MDEDGVLRLLRAWLDGEGAGWTEENGWLRFRTEHGAARWETACRAQPDGLLLYSRWPFRPADAEKAGRLCGEINRALVRGAVFLAEDGHPVYRCRAELDDVYGAGDRLTAAIEYAAQVICAYWGRLSAS